LEKNVAFRGGQILTERACSAKNAHLDAEASPVSRRNHLRSNAVACAPTKKIGVLSIVKVSPVHHDRS